MKLIEKIFNRHWSAQTSFYENWSLSAPSCGQCAVSALKVNDLLGGEIARIKVNKGQPHYYNIINGEIIDATSAQFGEKINYQKEEFVTRKRLLADTGTFSRYKMFSDSVNEEINKRLPLKEIDHVCIRTPRYVAGSDKKPEVRVFCQTNKRGLPLNENLVSADQAVHMKWVGGPIVAKSRILSWHSGKFKDSNINKIRELTNGTSLFALSDYWESVSRKKNGYYSVIHLYNEEWLEDLIYPSQQSFGSSWVYLDTLKKKIQWLCLHYEPEIKNNKGRPLPVSIRFNVLKRDNFTCQYCGRRAPEVELHIDHVKPWSKVKEHNIDNLVVACRECNSGKGVQELTDG